MTCGSPSGSENQILIPRYSSGPILTSHASACDAPACADMDFGVRVFHRVYGAKTIIWDLAKSPQLRALNVPLETKIQFGHTGAADPANWQDLTNFAADTGQYIDDTQRFFSQESNTYYRVVVRTQGGSVLASAAVRAQDTLPMRLYPVLAETLRRWQLRARNHELRPGFLLKKRRWGHRCDACRDRDSGRIIETDCRDCYDTGFTGGFFLPIGCSFAAVGEYTIQESFDDQLGYATDGYMTQLTMLGIPSIYPGDVWVEYDTDHRWAIANVAFKQRVGTIETFVICSAFRIAPTSVVYEFDITRGE